MRKLFPLFASVALFSGQAFAADLPTHKDAPSFLAAPPIYSWTGFYAGVDAGGSFGSVDFHNRTFNSAALPAVGAIITPLTPGFNYSSSSVIGGAEAGYNYQSGLFVGGVEADAGVSSPGSSVNRITTPSAALIAAHPGDIVVPQSFTAKQSSGFFGTARLRAGITPIDRLLIFATGGVAVASDGFTTILQPIGIGSAISASKSITAVAPVLGGGAEYAVTNNWSLKAEYLHAWMPSITIDYPAAAVSQRVHTFDEGLNIVRIGLNYHM
jgi:outer membrane immunogenic protein